MPTLVPEPHEERAVAESFGLDAERYDRARPRYPDGLIERIVTAAPGPSVLDVGVGTGIVARQLRTAGCRVLGVDPDERMAELARRDGIEVEIAKFETWNPMDRTFDAVTAGQTWHWVDPVAGAAKAAEVLHPGGLLAVFWNVQQPPSELAEAMGAVFNRVMPNSLAAAWTSKAPSPDAYAPLCEKAADGIRQSGAFDAPEEWRFDWDRLYTRDEWLDALPTQGGSHQVPPDKLQEALAGIGAAIGDAFTMHYTTVAVTTHS